MNILGDLIKAIMWTKSFGIHVICILFIACAGVPKGIEPVDDFRASGYLGQWYEIYRYDHRFERGLSQVTAEYSIDTDNKGGADTAVGPDTRISVINKGFDPSTQKWQSAEGKAKFKASESIGHLLVSFFGPFYSSYVIFHTEWDDDKKRYDQAFVTGPNRDYFWWLHRQAVPDQTDHENARKVISENGFTWDNIIVVNQE